MANKLTCGRPRIVYSDNIEDLGILTERKSKFEGTKIHLSIKEKIDSYDPKFEKSVNIKDKIYSGGIVLDGNKVSFPSLDTRFEYLNKWNIEDYIEFYHYVINRCRVIEGKRGYKNIILNLSNITNTEIEGLGKISKTLSKLESIIRDYFIKSSITYDQLKERMGFDIPVYVFESLTTEAKQVMLHSDYIE